MFQKNADPEKVAVIVIEDYFRNIRTMCQQEMSKMQERSARHMGRSYMQSIVTNVLEMVPKEKQPLLLTRMHQNYVDVLMDYDRQWVWTLFNEFTGELPETMLN